MTITCNGCGRDFPLDPYYVDTLRDGDLEVRYFTCPACRTRYHILTTDTAMRQLIQKREALASAIKMAKVKGFQESTFRKYLARLDKVKAEQMKILPALTKRGEEILKGGTHGEEI